MWAGRAQSRRRCGRGEPSPDADVGGVSPVPTQMWAAVSPVPAQRWTGQVKSRRRGGRFYPSPVPASLSAHSSAHIRWSSALQIQQIMPIPVPTVTQGVPGTANARPENANLGFRLRAWRSSTSSSLAAVRAALRTRRSPAPTPPPAVVHRRRRAVPPRHKRSPLCPSGDGGATMRRPSESCRDPAKPPRGYEAKSCKYTTTQTTRQSLHLARRPSRADRSLKRPPNCGTWRNSQSVARVGGHPVMRARRLAHLRELTQSPRRERGYVGGSGAKWERG